MANSNNEDAIFNDVIELGKQLENMGVPIEQNVLQRANNLMNLGIFETLRRQFNQNRRNNLYYRNLHEYLKIAGVGANIFALFSTLLTTTGVVKEYPLISLYKGIKNSNILKNVIKKFLNNEEIQKLQNDYLQDFTKMIDNKPANDFDIDLNELALKIVEYANKENIPIIEDSYTPKNKNKLEEMKLNAVKTLLYDDPDIRSVYLEFAYPMTQNLTKIANNKTSDTSFHLKEFNGLTNYDNFNFAGPYTDLYGRLSLKFGPQNAVPLNKLDYYSLMHDIAYISDNPVIKKKADAEYQKNINNFMQKNNLSLQGNLQNYFAYYGVKMMQGKHRAIEELYKKFKPEAILNKQQEKEYTEAYKNIVRKFNKFLNKAGLDYETYNKNNQIFVSNKMSLKDEIDNYYLKFDKTTKIEPNTVGDYWNDFIKAVNQFARVADKNEGEFRISPSIVIPAVKPEDYTKLSDINNFKSGPIIEEVEEVMTDKNEPKLSIGAYQEMVERLNDLNNNFAKQGSTAYDKRVAILDKFLSDLKDKELYKLLNKDKIINDLGNNDDSQRIIKQIEKKMGYVWGNITKMEKGLDNLVAKQAVMKKKPSEKTIQKNIEVQKRLKEIIPSIKQNIGFYPYSAQHIAESKKIVSDIQKQIEYINNHPDISNNRKTEIEKQLKQYSQSVSLYTDPADVMDDPRPNIPELKDFNDSSESKQDSTPIEVEINAYPPKYTNTTETSKPSTGFVPQPIDTGALVRLPPVKGKPILASDASAPNPKIPEGKNKKPSGNGKLRPTFEMPNEDAVAETDYEEKYDLKFWTLFNVTELHDYGTQMANTINNPLAELENQNNKILYKNMSFKDYYTQNNNPWDEGNMFRQPIPAFDDVAAKKRASQTKVSQAYYQNQYQNSDNMKIPFINQVAPQNIPFKNQYYNEGSTVLNKSIYDGFSSITATDYHPDDIFKNNALYYGEF